MSDSKHPSPIFTSERQAADLLDMPSAIQALRRAFAARASGAIINAPRFRARLRRSLNVTAAQDETAGRSAVKVYGGSSHHILLYSEDNGLLAVMEAAWLGQLRTGAASGLATELMARSDARNVGLIGAGRQADAQLLALRAADRLDRAMVFARDRAKLEAFCARMEDELQRPVLPAASAEEAVAGADVIVTATTSARPVLQAEWISPGAHVNAIGANAASRAELDPQIVAQAGLVAVDDVEQAKIEAAELIQSAAEGRLDWAHVLPLHRFLEPNPPRREPGSVTVFKSLGVGLEDLAIASLLYDRLVHG